MAEFGPSSETSRVTHSALWEAWLRGENLRDVRIVDAHAHLGDLAEFYIPQGGSPAAMIDLMDRLGICCCVAAPFAAWAGEPEEGHDAVFRASQDYPQRFYGYCVYNPALGVERALEELLRRLAHPAFLGIKIAPSTHGFPVDGADYRPMWEIAHQRGLVVLSHSWHGTPEDDPWRFEAVGRAYPHARILLGHSGGTPEGMAAAIEVARKVPNLYLEISGSRVAFGILERMVKAVGAERVVFGSDMPFLDPRWKLGQVLGAHLSDAEKEKILGKNAEQLFGLRSKTD
ncbi:MAG: amidohydrolase family protein [candidate division KSB1 bacterium]|nr:amidohydrolase family protein [candidate division KSB1 bacterium]